MGARVQPAAEAVNLHFFVGMALAAHTVIHAKCKKVLPTSQVRTESNLFSHELLVPKIW